MASRAQLDLEVQMKGADKAAADMNKLSDGAGKVDTKMKGLSGVFGSLPGPLGMATAAGAAFVGFLGAAAKAAAEEEKGIKRLEQTLKNNGFEGAAGDVEKYIAKQEKLAFADDELRDSLNDLVTATGSLEKAQTLQSTAMDLARAKNISLETATKLVGKVNAENIGVLGRYGIAIDKNATAEEALAKIREKTAGQAEGYAKSSAGAMERITNALGNVFEDIGSKVLGVMEGPIQGLADFLQSEEFQGIATFVTDVLGAAFTVLGTVIGTAFDAIMIVARPIIDFLKGAKEVVEGIWNFFTGGAPDEVEALPGDVGGALEDAASRAKIASDQMGTDVPAGFKRAADGAIVEIERIPTATELAIQAATSKWEEIDMGGKLKFVVTPALEVQEISDTEIDALNNSIRLLVEAGGTNEQVQVAVKTAVTFSDVAVAEGQEEALNARIEELMQSGLSAQQAKAIIEREVQIKANVNQDLADAENSRRQAQSALDSGVGGDTPYNVEINANATLGPGTVTSIEAAAASCKPIFLTEIEKPFPVTVNPTPLLGPTVLPAAQAGGVAIASTLAGGVTSATPTAVAAAQAMAAACLTATNTGLPAATIQGYGNRIPTQTEAGIIAGTPLAKQATDNLTQKVKDSMSTGLAPNQFHLLAVAIPTTVGGGINQAAGTATAAATAMASNVRAETAHADDNAFSTGQGIGTGLANGIGSMFQRVYNAAYALARQAKTAAENALESKSPSKVFHRMGEDVDVGFAQGITAHGQSVQDATLKMVDERVVNVARARINALFSKLPEDDIAAIKASGEAAGREWGYGFDPTVDLCDPIETASAHAEECAGSGGASAAQAWIDGFNDRMASGEVNVGPYQSGEAYDPGGRGAGSGGSGRRAMASGGAFWTQGPTNLLVGEAGREFVSVTPAGQVGAGGMVVNLTVNAGLGADGKGIAREVIDALSIMLRTHERQLAGGTYG